MTRRTEWPERRPKRVVRFEVEDEDGTVTRLTGDAADAWTREINEALAWYQIHEGHTLSTPPFETVRRDGSTERTRADR